jgi:hypothetical protein
MDQHPLVAALTTAPQLDDDWHDEFCDRARSAKVIRCDAADQACGVVSIVDLDRWE